MLDPQLREAVRRRADAYLRLFTLPVIGFVFERTSPLIGPRRKMKEARLVDRAHRLTMEGDRTFQADNRRLSLNSRPPAEVGLETVDLASLGREPKRVVPHVPSDIEHLRGTGLPNVRQAELKPLFLVDSSEEGAPVHQICGGPGMHDPRKRKHQRRLRLPVRVKADAKKPVPSPENAHEPQTAQHSREKNAGPHLHRDVLPGRAG